VIIDGNKFIEFQLREDNGKTQIWDVINKADGYNLGLITWWHYGQYVFEPAGNGCNSGCLDCISYFMKRLNHEKRITEVKARG
jgi:hypothetical protein